MFQAKMGSIKERGGMDLTEAEEIKERWQEYTELNEKVLITQITKMECYSPTARHPGM